MDLQAQGRRRVGRVPEAQSIPIDEACDDLAVGERQMVRPVIASAFPWDAMPLSSPYMNAAAGTNEAHKVSSVVEEFFDFQRDRGRRAIGSSFLLLTPRGPCQDRVMNPSWCS